VGDNKNRLKTHNRLHCCLLTLEDLMTDGLSAKIMYFLVSLKHESSFSRYLQLPTSFNMRNALLVFCLYLLHHQ
jgi:hypothetical protein